ncbi:MAG: ribbon-helix-helix domain-containing protein [Anaerolineae bacterium]
MRLQRVTFSVPEAIVAATDAIVRKERRSRSSILREAIEQYLKAREEMEMIAEYTEAADLNRALAEGHLEAFNEISAPGV